MKILGISDLHGSWESCAKLLKYSSEEEIDLVLFAGDLESPELVDELLKFPRILGVPGNMDSQDVIQRLSSINLHSRSIKIDQYEFFGIGGHTHDLRLEQFSPSSSKLILISHKPPYGILDRTLTGKHIGSSLVRGFVQRFKPLICLCGHVHEFPGISWLGKSLIVNPGPASLGRAALIDPSAQQAQLIKI